MKVKVEIPIDLDTVLAFIEECRSDYALEVICDAAKARIASRVEEQKQLDELRKFWEEST